MSLQLRNAREDERELIKDVTLSAYSDYSTVSFWEPYRENILHTLLDSQAAEQIVAEQDEQIVGAVLLYPTSDMNGPEVRLLAVSPTARGQGIGESLVQECIQRATRAGAPILTLRTVNIMLSAIRLYERIGFIRVPELDVERAPNVIATAYRLPLIPEPLISE